MSSSVTLDRGATHRRIHYLWPAREEEEKKANSAIDAAINIFQLTRVCSAEASLISDSNKARPDCSNRNPVATG